MSLSRVGSSSSMKSATVSPQKGPIGIKCACGHDAIRLISKTKKNPDRPFYKCPEDNGCKLFKWEDEISGPSHQTAPRTPPSSQSQSSQPTMQTPARAVNSASSLVKTLWTNQTPSRPPMSTNSTKRKRSPSPSPTPSPSAITIQGGCGVTASNSRPSLSLGPFGSEAANAFSRSVANPVTSTSKRGDESGSASPTKRARLDTANPAGSIFSDDEDLWADAALDILALPLDEAHGKEEFKVSSAQPLKKSVSFQEVTGDGNDNIDDEDGILVDTSILRLLDFKNKRGPSPDRLINLHVRDGTTEEFPILDDDPSNPFRAHKTPDKPSTSYANGTPTQTPRGLPTPSTLAGLSSAGNLSTNASPSSTDPMPTLCRLEELLPELASALPDARLKIMRLEKLRAGDAKSIAWKSQKIKALTEEVGGLKEEIARLREENERLSGV